MYCTSLDFFSLNSQLLKKMAYRKDFNVFVATNTGILKGNITFLGNLGYFKLTLPISSRCKLKNQ
jgi:hypothetical protein